jgi:hypothetical protein
MKILFDEILAELPTNRWPQLQGLIPRLLEALQNIQPGSYIIL